MKTELVALLLVILAVAGVPSAVAVYDGFERAGRPRGEISLVGHTPLNGNWSQRVIGVTLGETVRLRLTSEDVVHGFLVPDFGINAGPITPGKFKTIEFVADRRGEFKFYCNILCSHQHGGMTGKIVVE
ncbi:MAG: hypothetical protein HYX92_12045 [Chloroflexi bacterium]|nr:hypothetical protein [Chloroflexota bacterium]